MNQDWEENEIRRLFRELRREDEGLAPSFAKDWDAALSRINKGRRARLTFRLPVTAAVALALLGSLAFVIFRRVPLRTTPTATSEPAAAIARQSPSAITFDVAPAVSSKTSETKKRAKGGTSLRLGFDKIEPTTIRRPLPKQSQSPDILISRWRSPTDFLLKSVDDQFLRTTPRLNASTAEIKASGFVGND